MTANKNSSMKYLYYWFDSAIYIRIAFAYISSKLDNFFP